MTPNSKCDDITICSLNVRGLANNMKRRETFRWLKGKNYSIYFLQEVHGSNETVNFWSSEWGYKTLFSNYSSSRAGVCILFKNNFEFKILKYLADSEGRFIIADIQLENKTLTLVNIYAPNQDDPSFFKNISDKILSFECEYLVLGGDFNLVQDISKDKKGGNASTHFKSLDEIEIIKEKLDLTDIWRDLNPDTIRFTWRRRNPEIHCRLDFFLISSTLCTNALEADILPGYKTDHSMITLCIITKTNPRGPGFWKLNTHFLTDLEYVNLIKETLIEVSREYENHTEVDAILLWDMIKMKIRANSIIYAKRQKSRFKQNEAILEQEISALEKRSEENSLSDEDKQPILAELRTKRQQMEQMIHYKTQGAILRCKTRWYNDGERNTSYFLNLEKRHFNKKSIRNLKTDNNTTVFSDADILNEAKQFYMTLYSSNLNNPVAIDIDYERSFFPEDNNQIKRMPEKPK